MDNATFQALIADPQDHQLGDEIRNFFYSDLVALGLPGTTDKRRRYSSLRDASDTLN